MLKEDLQDESLEIRARALKYFKRNPIGYSKDADGWAKGPPPPYNFAEGLCEIVSNLLRKMEEKKRKEELK